MRHPSRLTVFALVAWATALVSPAAIIYVDGVAGNDGWSGACRTHQGGNCGPKRTIQAGIDVSSDGDTVIVLDGTYTGPGNRQMKFGGRTITLRSENGPQACIITGLGMDYVLFLFDSGETPAAAVEGFTITDTALC